MILRDTIIKVNLDKIKHNMKLIHEMCGKDVAIMPVVKANGYGHGAVGIAKTLMESGASHLAVATLIEALEIREAYADYPIMILGHTPDRFLSEIVKYDIVQTVFSNEQAKILSDTAVEANKKVKIHIKVDTGFHRLGIYDEDEIVKICSNPNIDTEGIFSHLALVNDEENKIQYDKFTAMIDRLEKRGITFRYKHIADSISLVDYPEYRMKCMADLTGVPDPQVGDTAIIYGDGNNNTMSIQEASELAETNKNEIVARILARPPRAYLSSKED